MSSVKTPWMRAPLDADVVRGREHDDERDGRELPRKRADVGHDPARRELGTNTAKYVAKPTATAAFDPV
jgi:hypothetical protein